jgi:hypothetical protein
MKYIAYIVAAMLIAGWLIGILLFERGGIFHVLPMIAVIIVILRVIQGNLSMKSYSRHINR